MKKILFNLYSASTAALIAVAIILFNLFCELCSASAAALIAVAIVYYVKLLIER